MATAIPSSMTFEMLSRLPPNSFVQVWKEIRPSVLPPNGRYSLTAGQPTRVNFVLRGAPNEFLLNTETYLSGTAFSSALCQLTGSLTSPLDNHDLLAIKSTPPVLLNKPIHWFQASRESFNSGSLPFLDNQDPQASHEYNELRASLTKRNQPRGRGEQMLEDCQSWLGSTDTYESRDVFQAVADLAQYNSCFRPVFISTAASPPAQPLPVMKVDVLGKNCDFRIPLGMYSNLVNSHSVIPIGLMSSYSVNGWQIDLDITSTPARSYSTTTEVDASVEVGVERLLTVSQHSANVTDLRVYACIIRVLDPSVMEAVLSLYEKREMVNVGGVQFPLSLRLNSLGYRFSRFPLNANQQDYYFRITGTDRSVRALAWRVFDTTMNAEGSWSLDTPYVLTRLETSIGSELPHPVIEDLSPQTSNISNFISMNIKRSGALFSALPYYQEDIRHSGDASDGWMPYNNAFVCFADAPTPSDNQLVLQGILSPVSQKRRALCQGLISFENLDRREGDFSGSFQASGKDLTNVGAIELRMRFQRTSAVLETTAVPTDVAGVEALSTAFTFQSPVNPNLQIVFAYVYDSVMEVSPQGVMDITNATL
jgi:hypothetical protein